MNLRSNRFLTKVKSGVAAVQKAYRDQKQAMDERAKRQMAAARSSYDRQRIKAENERETLRMKREMYEAEAAVKREREAVEDARKRAGHLSFSERLRGATGKSRGKSGKAASSGLSKVSKFLWGTPKRKVRRVKRVVRRRK